MSAGPSSSRRPCVRPSRGARVRRAGLVAVAAASALLVAACGAPTIPADSPAYTPAAPAAPTPLAADTCQNPLQSYKPYGAGDDRFPSGSLQAAVVKRGRLVVGVSGDSRLLGARKAGEPNTFEGFDIDMARAVARGLFGPGGESKVQFRVITAAQRIPLVNAGVDDGGVDLVARNMTVNCARWDQVAFSAVYFTADQRILVRAVGGRPEFAATELGPKKARVCAPAGSTSISRIASDPAYAGIVPVSVDQHTTCLALLQQGRVEAITGDSTVLAGLVDQDKGNVVVLPTLVGKKGVEPYGLAVAKDQKEFVRFVNTVLRQYVADGGWQKAYDTYFGKALGPASPPSPEYGR